MNRVRGSMVALLAVALLPGVVSAAKSDGACDVTFHAKATMHAFDGTVKTEQVKVDRKGDAATLSVEVPIEAITTGHKKRDKEMYHMFHSDKHPTLSAKMDDARLTNAAKAGKPVPFTMTIGETTKQLAATISEYTEADGKVSFLATFPVSLAAFQLEPPSPLFLKVDDTVNVEARLTLKK